MLVSSLAWPENSTSVGSSRALLGRVPRYVSCATPSQAKLSNEMRVLNQNSDIAHTSFGRGIQGGYIRSRVRREENSRLIPPQPVLEPENLNGQVNGDSTAGTNGTLDDRPATPPAGTRPGLARAKSDFGPRRTEPDKHPEDAGKENAKDEWEIRHGWEAQLTSEEYLNHLNNV